MRLAPEIAAGVRSGPPLNARGRLEIQQPRDWPGFSRPRRASLAEQERCLDVRLPIRRKIVPALVLDGRRRSEGTAPAQITQHVGLHGGEHRIGRGGPACASAASVFTPDASQESFFQIVSRRGRRQSTVASPRRAAASTIDRATDTPGFLPPTPDDILALQRFA